MNMKTTTIVFSALAAAAINAAAAEPLANFDGLAGPAPLGAGLVSAVEEAAAAIFPAPVPAPAPEFPEARFPGSRYYVPPVNGPYCIANCGGADTGPDGSDTVPGGADAEPQQSFTVPPVTSDLEQTINVLVCMKRGELSSPDCGKKKLRELAALEGWDMLQDIFVDNAKETLSFHFPVPMSILLFGQSLYQIQMHGLDVVRKRLLEDNKKLAPAESDPQIEKARKLRMMADNSRMIKGWYKEAVFDATRASNWQEVQDKVFAFNGGTAYRQLGRSLMGFEVLRKKASRP